MAVREIKTTIALDGEQKFKQAIAAASREMRVMDSELKAVTAAYENNGDAAAYYAQKQANLKNQISQQKQIIDSLEQAVQDATKAYGAGSSQVDGYAIKLNNARTRMSKLEKQLEETDREVEELGRDSIKAGRQLEQGIGEGAEEAERDVKSLIQTMQEDISSIRTSSAVSALTSLWDMASGAYSSVAGFVDGTLDYRRQLSFLMQNAAEGGFGTESVENQLIEVQGIIGESAAAMEGLNTLLQIGFDETMLNRAMQGLLGAYAAFPETLKFESLSESLQETLATGTATGQYAELLERLKVDIDEFNKALEESPDAIGDMDIALSYLEADELDEAYQKYRQDHEDLIRELETLANLEYQSARLGEKLSKHITTPIKEDFANLLGWMADEITAFETNPDKYIEEIPQRLEESREDTAVKAVENAVETAFSSKETNQQIVKNNLAMRDAIISGITGLFREETWEKAGEAIKEFEESMNNASDMIESQAENAESRLDALVSRGLMTSNQSNYLKSRYISGTSVDRELLDVIAEYESAGQEAAAAFLNGMEMELDTSTWFEEAENAALQTLSPVTGAFENWGQIIKDAKKKLQEAERDFADAGEDAGSAFADAFESSAQDMIGRFSILGMQAGMAYGTGLRSTVSYVSSAAAAVSAAAQTGLATARAGVRDIILQVDGREFARTTASYYDEALSVGE